MGLENDAKFVRFLEQGIRENFAAQAYYKNLLAANLQKIEDIGKYHKEVASPAILLSGPLRIWNDVPDSAREKIKEQVRGLVKKAKAENDKTSQLILERIRFNFQEWDVHPPNDFPSLDWIDADVEQRPLERKAIPESTSRKTEFVMATKLIRGFVMKTIAQGEERPTAAVIERNNRIFAALTENEGFDLGSPGAASEAVLNFAREQIDKTISELSKITDPGEKTANLGRVREVRDLAGAYKLLKEVAPQELEMLVKKVNT